MPSRKDLQPTVQPEALQPQARPVNTFVRPATPTDASAIGQSTTAQLAQALSSFSPALESMERERKARLQREAEAVALDKINGLTLQEANDLVQSGELRAEHSPWAQAAFEKLFGRRAAAEKLNQLQTAIARGDIDPVTADFDQILSDEHSLLSGSVESDFFQSGMNSVFAEGSEKIKAFGDKSKTAAFLKERNDTIVNNMLQDVEGGDAEGMSSEQIVNELVRPYYESNQKMFNINRGDTDKMVVGVADLLAAQGKEGLVKELLTKRRGDTPSISDKPEFRSDVSRIISTAEGKQFEETARIHRETRVGFNVAATFGALDEAALEEAASEGVFGRKEVERLKEQNRVAKIREATKAQSENTLLWRKAQEAAIISGQVGSLLEGRADELEDISVIMLDPNGKPAEITVSRDAQIEAATNNIFASIDKAAADPGSRVRLKANYLARNGISYPLWERMLAAGPQRAAVAALDDNEQPIVDQQITGSYDLYKQLQATNPGQKSAHIKDREVEAFYNSAFIAERYRGLEPEAALQQAVVAAQRPAGLKAFTPRQIDDLRTQAQGVASQFFGADASNVGTVTNTLFRIASTMPDIAPAEALERAKELYEDNHSIIDGWSQYHGGRMAELEGFYEQVSPFAKQEFLDDNSPDDTDEDDLLLAPVLAGQKGIWWLINKRNQAPVMRENGEPYKFTANDLRKRARTSAIEELNEELGERSPIKEGQGVVERALGVDFDDSDKGKAAESDDVLF